MEVLNMLGKIAQTAIDEKSGELIQLATKIWENPEIAYQEVKASTWTAEMLEKEGFTVEKGYAGVPTALRATWGSGKPVIGFLGEYDALPDLSQKVSTKKEPVIEGGIGHGCGHNLLGVGHAGAVIGLKKEMEERNLAGTVVFYGCPAEELLTGKTFMAREGAFRDLDIVFAWHPSMMNGILMGNMVAANSAKFHFKGLTAHAGGDPQNGRSALDAAELMNVGANFLREHVTDDVRIHYAFTDVHGAPNVVPDKASVWYYVRALSRTTVDDAYERLIKVAKGAAMMTETDVDIEFLGGCYNTLQNKVLAETVHDTMNEIQFPEWSEEEVKFAEALNNSEPAYSRMVAAGYVKEGVHLNSAIAPLLYMDASGSSDVGDVQHIAPGIFFMTTCYNNGAPNHSWHSTTCSGHSLGMKGMLYGAKVMAVSALKAIEDPSIIEKAKEEFQKAMAGREYVCPIPEEIPVP